MTTSEQTDDYPERLDPKTELPASSCQQITHHEWVEADQICRHLRTAPVNATRTVAAASAMYVASAALTDDEGVVNINRDNEYLTLEQAADLTRSGCSTFAVRHQVTNVAASVLYGMELDGSEMDEDVLAMLVDPGVSLRDFHDAR